MVRLLGVFSELMKGGATTLKLHNVLKSRLNLASFLHCRMTGAASPVQTCTTRLVVYLRNFMK